KGHGDRRKRMAEEQAEAMDEADLDEEKGQAEHEEIEGDTAPCRRTRLARRVRQGDERKENEDDRRSHRLDQSEQAYEIAAIDKDKAALFLQCNELRQKLPGEETVEERAIISRRMNVEFVIGEEGRSVGAQQCDSRVMKCRRGHAVEAVGFAG